MKKQVIFKADLDNIVVDLEARNLYSSNERDVARFCLACLILGANKRKVKKLANCENFEEYWANLEANHYFNQDKTVNIEGLDTDIPFLIMINCAKGFFERVKEEV